MNNQSFWIIDPQKIDSPVLKFIDENVCGVWGDDYQT